ncbi:hypothetical protein SteCoe_31970 [Stentor coeruleus]|uniref:Sphingomyelin synthase-like domain-containing protein n=1 Tax=Stentor coeruleus TaxID=5963 RepID=A0A1R2B048_9CILI|nr:hypothetical protein SteCoe_31970 [Stentor coeruleus]
MEQEIHGNETFRQKFRRNNLETKTKRITFGIRVFILVGIFISGVLNSITGWAVQQTVVECIEDKGFQIFEAINKIFAGNENLKMIFISIAAGLCDLLFVIFAVRFLFWGSSSKSIVFLFIYYSLAGFMKIIFTATPANGACWEDAYPSFILPDEISPNFYYSTAPGLLLFFVFEYYSSQNKPLMWLSVVTLAFVSLISIILQKDYTVGIISSLCMSHYLNIISERISSILDPIVFPTKD